MMHLYLTGHYVSSATVVLLNLHFTFSVPTKLDTQTALLFELVSELPRLPTLYIVINNTLIL